jgi:predicted metal-dependent phosphoesterase TrpH
MIVRPWAAPGRFYKGNLHAHSTLSDGQFPIDDVVAGYRQQGYDFLSMTEHNFIADTRSYRDESFTTLLGTELNSPITRGKPHRFINAIGLPLDFPLDLKRDVPDETRELLPDVARRAREAGAWVTIACPAWCGTTTDAVIAIEAAHAVETFSQTCALSNDRGLSWHLVDEAAERGVRLMGMAVDDSHATRDKYAAWAEVKAERLDPDALLDALKAGNYYHTQGPKIHDLRIDGATLSIECSPVEEVILSGLSWRGGGTHGMAITSASIPLTHFDTGYVRVTIVDRAGKRAWTNPIWLDSLGN